MTNPRVDGRFLLLEFDGLQIACDTTSVMLENEDADADLVTFGDVISGDDKQWFFTISSLPSYAAGTFWALLWDTPAYTPIPYLFNPLASPFATVDKPWFTGEATVDRKPPVGGDAGSVWSFTARLTCTATPTRVTTGGP